MTYNSTEFRLREAVAIRSFADSDFRQQLLSDPQDALESLTDEPISRPIDFRVIEDTEFLVNLVIPPAPEGELSEEELELVAGGVNNFASGKVADPTLLGQISNYGHPAFKNLDTHNHNC